MSTTDPRPAIGLALDQAGRLIDSVGTDQLALPTPCDEYDVRALLGHLFTVVKRIDLALQGGNPLEIPVVTTGIDDHSGEWKTRRAALDETLADDAVLGRICTLPWQRCLARPRSAPTPANSPPTAGTSPPPSGGQTS
jgi:hypothetical protein